MNWNPCTVVLSCIRIISCENSLTDLATTNPNDFAFDVVCPVVYMSLRPSYKMMIFTDFSSTNKECEVSQLSLRTLIYAVYYHLGFTRSVSVFSFSVPYSFLPPIPLRLFNIHVIQLNSRSSEFGNRCSILFDFRKITSFVTRQL